VIGSDSGIRGARATRSPTIQPAPDEDSDERQEDDGRDKRFEIHDH